MLIRRFDPLNDIREFQESFEQMSKLFNTIQNFQRDVQTIDFVPAVNTREADDAYFLEVDLPGVDKENVSIDIENNVLKISGERRLKEDRRGDEFYRVESLYGKFEREFTLPEDIDESKIEAEMEDGVLYIKIPKKQIIDNAPKKIKIR